MHREWLNAFWKGYARLEWRLLLPRRWVWHLKAFSCATTEWSTPSVSVRWCWSNFCVRPETSEYRLKMTNPSESQITPTTILVDVQLQRDADEQDASVQEL